MNENASGKDLSAGITDEQIEKYLARKAQAEATRRVGATPLPGPLLDAFDPPTVVIAGLTMLPITAGHIAILQRIDSPLLRAVERMQSPGDATAKDDDDEAGIEGTVETLYVFATEPRELRQTIAKGRELFREAAMQAVGDGLPLRLVGEVTRALGEYFARSFATSIEYEQSGGGGESDQLIVGGEGFPSPPMKT